MESTESMNGVFGFWCGRVVRGICFCSEDIQNNALLSFQEWTHLDRFRQSAFLQQMCDEFLPELESVWFCSKQERLMITQTSVIQWGPGGFPAAVSRSSLLASTTNASSKLSVFHRFWKPYIPPPPPPPLPPRPPPNEEKKRKFVWDVKDNEWTRRHRGWFGTRRNEVESGGSWHANEQSVQPMRKHKWIPSNRNSSAIQDWFSRGSKRSRTTWTSSEASGDLWTSDEDLSDSCGLQWKARGELSDPDSPLPEPDSPG